MNTSTLENSIAQLTKALEAGNTSAAPNTLVAGAALQVEDLSAVIENLTFQDKHIILQKDLRVESCKSNLAQFDRQLSYGIFGGSAQLEGAVGQEETLEVVRVTVPMCFYSHIRKQTLAADMVATVDGMSATDRQAEAGARKMMGDIEFDLFQGQSNFSNGGVFDGSPAAIPQVLPNIHGLDVQIRQSDAQFIAKDLMFGSFGSNDTVVIQGGGTLTQDNVEDCWVRSVMNMGTADELMLDPKALSAYNKLGFGKERIVLSGTPMDRTGSDLRRQSTSGGEVELKASRFLSGKTGPLSQRSNVNAPLAPTIAAGSQAASTTPFQATQVYTYLVSAQNVIGESQLSSSLAITVATSGNTIPVTITANGSGGAALFFNVYRTKAGGAASTARFIGSVTATSGTTTFTDLGNKLPGFVTGFLVQKDTWAIKELAGYSRVKLAQTELATTFASYRFACLAGYQPRKNVICDNLTGSF